MSAKNIVMCFGLGYGTGVLLIESLSIEVSMGLRLTALLFVIAAFVVYLFYGRVE